MTDQNLKRFCILICNFDFCILIFGFLCGCQSGNLYKDNRVLMGTFVEVASEDKRAPEIVFNEIKRVESLLSKYKQGSGVSRLNKTGKIQASPETFYVIKKAKEFSEKSGGAFDITVGPLVDLWGFSQKKYRVPDEESIKEALKLVGSDKIILNSRNNVIELKIQGMKIDLGAIAKGYAIDCAVKKLRESGIKSCLINAGGQIYALGTKSGRPWNIALRNPYKKTFKEHFKLTDKAVATSGGYEQYFVKNNRHYSHILDPLTGYPAQTRIASVTVIAGDGLTADAVATALYVLGREKSTRLLNKYPGVTAKIYEEKDLR